MRFLMLVATDLTAEPYDRQHDTIDEWVAQHDAAGHRLVGDRLAPDGEAATVRRRGGAVVVTDGGFPETRGWLVGFDVLECVDVTEAVAVAAEHPMARFGRLEVRPFWSDDDAAREAAGLVP